jgi:hypothetical protein
VRLATSPSSETIRPTATSRLHRRLNQRFTAAPPVPFRCALNIPHHTREAEGLRRNYPGGKGPYLRTMGVAVPSGLYV